MKVNQATHPVGMMCRLLQVSRSGFYAWRDRPMCARRREDLALTGKIAAIHRFSRETYGSPMIHAELADDHDIRVGRKRVARLMRAAGLRGATLRKFVVTTMRSEQAPQVPDLVQRRFYAERPNRLWVADATYIPTWSGFLYLAIVLDVFSRKIVGWAMETHLKHRADAGGDRHGDHDAPTPRGDPSLRPGLPGRIHSVVATLQRWRLQ